jgi:deoxyadenosine/deoxycytidine kinase
MAFAPPYNIDSSLTTRSSHIGTMSGDYSAANGSSTVSDEEHRNRAKKTMSASELDKYDSLVQTFEDRLAEYHAQYESLIKEKTSKVDIETLTKTAMQDTLEAKELVHGQLAVCYR